MSEYTLEYSRNDIAACALSANLLTHSTSEQGMLMVMMTWPWNVVGVLDVPASSCSSCHLHIGLVIDAAKGEKELE